MAIEILPYGTSQKYLGRALTFRTPTEAEVNNRTSVAWRKFYALKQELTTKSYSLKGRLRLFHGTITPTILYGSSAWTLTTALQNKIRRTQRQMLRMIIHCPRRRQAPTNSQPPHLHNTQDQPVPESGNTTDTDEDPNDVDSNPPNDNTQQLLQPDDEEALEPWVDWIKRCTREVEAQMESLKLDDWITEQKRRKWRWARKVATESTMKWTTASLLWDPTDDPRFLARRQQGRPTKRWDDDIIQHIYDYNQQNQHQPQQPDEAQQVTQPQQTQPQPQPTTQQLHTPQPQQSTHMQLQHNPMETQPTQPQLHQDHFGGGSLYYDPDGDSDNDCGYNADYGTYFAGEPRISWINMASNAQLWDEMEAEYVTKS